MTGMIEQLNVISFLGVTLFIIIDNERKQSGETR